MKQLLTTLFCTIFVLLSCEKPSQGIVIAPPNTHPTLNPGGQGDNQGGNQEGGQEDNQQGNQEDNQQGNQEENQANPATPPDGCIIVGYVTYWGNTLPDPALLTHINYAFAHIKSDFESLDIKSASRLSKVADLKKVNPNLKISLSVGGWGAGNFSEMAADENHRKKFCQNCLAAVKKYNLDGIDLDWEYPTSSSAGISSSPGDKENFTLLVKDLRAALGDDRLVTMASSASAKYVDFKSCADYMNFVNLMTYDMGNPPYHNAGLYRSSMTKRSCDESVTLHLNAGVPLEKIVLGVPFYGRDNNKAFTASDPDDNFIYYNEIVKGGYTDRWDDDAKVPYLTDASGAMVLSYDNETSIGLKADYVRQKGLKGAMYWAVEGDDAQWTLSKAIASRLIGWTDPNPPQPAEAFLATNQYVEKFLEEVNYPCTNNPDTDAEYSYSSVIGYPGGGPSENNIEIPPTYTIKWTASSSSQKLRVWENSWSREYSLSGGVGSQEITNLVPNTTYQWQVTNSNSEIVANGTFDTRGMLHQVFFQPNVRNGRDLGGYKGYGGKTTVFHKLYRGGRIDKKYCNEEGRKEMLAEGIRAEVDLREASDVPSGSPLGSSVSFYAPGFDSGYNHMVRDNPEKVKNTFCWVVARLRENKPVYFHCAAGRDRTATLAVLLEGALGVSESDMAKDYELTYFTPAEWGMSKDDNGNYYYGHVRTTYSYKSIRKTIFSQTDSGTYQERIVKYLLKIGVPQKDIDDLRAIMLK
jgi:chitinase